MKHPFLYFLAAGLLVLVPVSRASAHGDEKHDAEATPAAAPAEKPANPATDGHDHRHEPLLPAPTTALEAVQQVDALVAAMEAAVTSKQLTEIHDQTEALSIALSGLQRHGAEGLSASKAKRLEGTVENLRNVGDALHVTADAADQTGSETNLEKLLKLHKLLAATLPDLAKQARATPLEQDFPGKVKPAEKEG